MSLAAGDLLAEASVRLTDRTGRAKQFRLNAKGLILGSAPGCDLRLEQSAPPVWVLLAACPGGVLIRSLAPLARIEVNGQRWQAGIASFPALAGKAKPQKGRPALPAWTPPSAMPSNR